jgi:hypothetical protein
VRGGFALGAVWLLILPLCGCAKPQQLGGLGALNPNGLEGRMALAGRVNNGAANRVKTLDSRDCRRLRLTRGCP